jgi:hypothetical protein
MGGIYLSSTGSFQFLDMFCPGFMMHSGELGVYVLSIVVLYKTLYFEHVWLWAAMLSHTATPSRPTSAFQNRASFGALDNPLESHKSRYKQLAVKYGRLLRWNYISSCRLH